jgi:tetratricopeptide (TPR) repeat protein
MEMGSNQYRTVIATGLCILVAVCSPCANAGDSASQRCTAQETRQIADPQQLVEACDKALGTSGLPAQQGSRYLIQRARGYESLGDGASALADLDRAVSLDPQSYLALDARAQYFVFGGDLAKAKKDEDAAFTLAPEAPERYGTKGMIYAEAFDTKTAIDIYDEGIKRFPDAWTLYLDRGTAYHSAGDDKRAMQDLDAAGRLAPKQYSVYAARGQIYQDEKQPLFAINEYDLAMTRIKTTDAGPILLGRCQAELRVGRAEQAVKDCNGALDADPSLKNAVRLYRGYAYLDAGSFAQASQDFKAELLFDPGVIAARYGRALADYGAGIPTAEQDLKTMLKDDPSWPCDLKGRFGAKPPPFWKPVPDPCAKPVP